MFTGDWDTVTEWCELLTFLLGHINYCKRIYPSFHSSQMSTKMSVIFFSFLSFRCNGSIRILSLETNALTFSLNINGMIILKQVQFLFWYSHILYGTSYCIWYINHEHKKPWHLCDFVTIPYTKSLKQFITLKWKYFLKGLPLVNFRNLISLK